VRSRVIHTTCVLWCSAPYSRGPVVVPGYLLMLRNRLAFSLPVLHSVSHLVLVMDCIDLLCADFIIMLGDILFGMAAVFAAWSACSFPSMFLCPDSHSIWMLQLGVYSWIFSIVSSISSIIYCPDWRIGVSTAWIADWLSVKMYILLYLSIISWNVVMAIRIAVNSAA
jgi:hypothetical protein